MNTFPPTPMPVLRLLRTMGSIAAILGAMVLSAQTITITFEGDLNGEPTPLDSILVMNLTQGGDTTIYFPDNVLVLASTRVGELADVVLGPVVCAPNPFMGSTEITVRNSGGGEMLVMVHDALGRELAVHHVAAAPGVHRFRFTASNAGSHVISVVQNGELRTARVHAMEGSAGGTSTIGYLGSTGSSGSFRSGRSVFSWMPGDELRYIGYANDGSVLVSAAIDEVPTASATRTFLLRTGAVCAESPTLTDVEGNVYRAVRIGNQCWMAENLRTGTYRNGIGIPNVINGTSWMQMTSAGCCSLENNTSNDAVHGKIYNGFVAANPNICPFGWHMPTDAEWQQLELALGMLPGQVSQTGERGAAQNVGGKLKSASLWTNPNNGATDAVGFAGVSTGFRTYVFDGGFYSLGTGAYWWSSTTDGSGGYWSRSLANITTSIGRNLILDRMGYCIRCVQD
jgi:uncharacterized protein (TIGR02145 family)